MSDGTPEEEPVCPECESPHPFSEEGGVIDSEDGITICPCQETSEDTKP